MISEIFKWVFSLVGKSMDVWFDLLLPVSNLSFVIGFVLVVSSVSLFFVLRYEYKNWGEMGTLGGVEFIFSGMVGVVITGLFFVLPALLWATLVSTIFCGFIYVIGYLVVLSVDGGKTNE